MKTQILVMVKEVGHPPYLSLLEVGHVDESIKAIIGQQKLCVVFHKKPDVRACIFNGVYDPGMTHNFTSSSGMDVQGTAVFAMHAPGLEAQSIATEDIEVLCNHYGWEIPEIQVIDMTNVQQPTPKVTWDRYKVLNWINNKYNIVNYQITSYEEAEELYRHFLAPIATIGPQFFDTVDCEIALEILDNWNLKANMNRVVPPLLNNSTYVKDMLKLEKAH